MRKNKKRGKAAFVSFDEYRKELFKNPKFVRAYNDLDPEFAVIEEIIKARIKKGITQKQLAKKMKTTQSAISRLESGNGNPSLALLKKLASALNTHLEVKFHPN